MRFADSPVLAPTFPPWRSRFVVGLLAIASTHILRGLALFPEAAQLLQGTLHPPRRAVSSAASRLIGLLYAAAR